MSKIKIPRTLATQHPDNVTNPFFSGRSILHGDDEIKEAFYSFSHLGAQEIMWDSEGKEADDFVIRKLMQSYADYFQENRIGRDRFITIRIPNPDHEKTEAKILIETLESIPRSYDTAKLFYGDGKYPPIFEVIVPMADEKVIKRLYSYYKNVVIGKQDYNFTDDEDLTVGEWIGDFRPKQINVIPLFEDIYEIMNAAKTVKAYLKGKEVEYQRVFLARSDPAMNYSSIAVILGLHIALERLYDLEKETGIKIYPILGSGSAPFRGSLTPANVPNILKAYPSVATYTIQSAFKYDFPVTDVQKAIELINSTKTSPPIRVENQKEVIRVIKKLSKEYQRQVQILAPLINEVAKFTPKRRLRKLHTGLFGYSRELKKGVTLPRVISFCAATYSMGLPPDILGLNILDQKDIDVIKSVYPRYEESIAEILSMWNEDVLNIIPSELRKNIRAAVKRFDFKINKNHHKISSQIIQAVKERQFGSHLTDLITQAGSARGFLG